MAEEDEAEYTDHRHAAMIQPRRPPVADRPAFRYSGVVTTEPVDWNRVAVEVADVARKRLREQPITPAPGLFVVAVRWPQHRTRNQPRTDSHGHDTCDADD